MEFRWNDEKNATVSRDRGISFERIVIAIEEGHLLDVLEHPNQVGHQGQLILIVEVDLYAVCVPCVVDENGNFFLKTLFKSRKYTKSYGLGGKDDK